MANSAPLTKHKSKLVEALRIAAEFDEEVTTPSLQRLLKGYSKLFTRAADRLEVLEQMNLELRDANNKKRARIKELEAALETLDAGEDI